MPLKLHQRFLKEQEKPLVFPELALYAMEEQYGASIAHSLDHCLVLTVSLMSNNTVFHSVYKLHRH